MNSTSGVVEVLKAAEKGLALKGQAYSCLYNSQSKCYVLSLEAHSSRITLPANDKPLALVQPFINFQIFILPGKPFTLELSVMDSSNSKRRLVFSSAVKTNTVSLMHARILNDQFPRNIWINLCIDLVAHMSRLFPSSTYRSLEEITIFSFCRIRRIFASRLPLMDAVDGQICSVPKSFDFNPGVETQTAIIRPRDQEESQKKPTGNTQQLKPSTLDKMRALRTASPQIQKRLTSSTSPAPRPQKSAPPHRIFPPKHLKSTTKTKLHGTFSTLSPQRIPMTKAAAVKHARQASVSPEKDVMYTTTHSKFDSAGTNLGDDVLSVQEEIEEEQKAADRSMARLHNEVGIQSQSQELHRVAERKPTFLESELDQVTNTRPFSPPFLGLSERNIEETKMQVKRKPDTEVELIHDPVLRCFYNPKTQEFFEIDN